MTASSVFSSLTRIPAPRHCFPQFVEALKLCDKAIVADIYAAREKNTFGISGKDIADQLDGGEYYPSFEQIEARVREIAQPNDLIITMGAPATSTASARSCVLTQSNLF